ncbi:MAG: hypothetical protein EPN93_10735 [Spirochaetes bacterium]|nr:MAG: hypothetical protein EPN93_10735 [Spirochaetota bacterium]
MKKSERGREVYYTIAWSKLYRYDKYDAMKVLPELAGILSLYEERPGNDPLFLLVYGCWRDGLRMGLKYLMDPHLPKRDALRRRLEGRPLLYKYTVVDSSPADMQDVMYWLIKNYAPELNTVDLFPDSKRYENISVRETDLRDDEVVERIPRYGL